MLSSGLWKPSPWTPNHPHHDWRDLSEIGLPSLHEMIVGGSGASGEQNALGALAAGDAVLSLGGDDEIAARHELMRLAGDGEGRLAADQHRVLGRRVPVRWKHEAGRKLRVADRPTGVRVDGDR